MNSASPNLVSLATSASPSPAGRDSSARTRSIACWQRASRCSSSTISRIHRPSRRPRKRSRSTAARRRPPRRWRDFKPNAVLHLASKGGVQVAARDPAGHARRQPREHDRPLRRGHQGRRQAAGERVVRRHDLRRFEEAPGARDRTRGAAVGVRGGQAVGGGLPRRPRQAPRRVRRSPCATATCTGRARTGPARRASSRSPATGCWTAASPRIFGDGHADARLHFRRRHRRRQRGCTRQPALGGARTSAPGSETSVADVVAMLIGHSGRETADRDGPRQGVRGQASLPRPAAGGALARLAPERRHAPGPGDHVRVVRGPERPALTAGDRMNTRKVELTCA